MTTAPPIEYIRPAWAVGLTERYRLIYGGRVSGKSYSVACELALELVSRPMTLLVCGSSSRPFGARVTGIPGELADVVIRVADMAEFYE